MLAILLLLVSCKFNYTTPMCSGDNLTDIPFLEGEYSKVENKLIDSNSIHFIRDSLGVYLIQEAGHVTEQMSTCQIKGEYYLEGNRDDLYHLLKVVAKKTKAKFNLMELLVDRLDELNIPYSVHEPTSPLLDFTSVIADNNNISNQMFINALTPDKETVNMFRVK